MHLCHKWGHGGTQNHLLENLEMCVVQKSIRSGVGGGMEIVCVICLPEIWSCSTDTMHADYITCKGSTSLTTQSKVQSHGFVYMKS